MNRQDAKKGKGEPGWIDDELARVVRLVERSCVVSSAIAVPLPNNQVTQIDPASAKIVNLYPLPNIQIELSKGGEGGGLKQNPGW